MEPDSFDEQSVVSASSTTSPRLGRNVEDRVLVVSRVRPFNSRELSLSGDAVPRSVVQIDDATLLRDPERDFEIRERFDFDANLWSVPACQQESPTPFCTQGDLFRCIGEPAVLSVLDGWNASIFAYGQTGAGKTFSMMGGAGDDEGLIPRVCRSLAAPRTSSPGRGERPKVSASYYEIYNERVRDLIPENDAVTSDLKIRNLPDQGPTVVGLNSVDIRSWEDCCEVLDRGLSRRSVAATKMNDRSSRSHSILTLTVETVRLVGDSVSRRSARLNLIDLAGSERVKKSGAEGARLREASAINLSLTTLKNVIDALVERRPNVPYRESKMTWLLSECLGGNSRTTMLVCVSPHQNNLEETQHSLRYGAKAQSIVCSPQVNEDTEKRRIAMLQDEVEGLQREIHASHRDALESLHVALDATRQRVVDARLNASRAGADCAHFEESLRREEQRCAAGAAAAAFAKLFSRRCTQLLHRENDALSFSFELEQNHFDREHADVSHARADTRRLRRQLEQLHSAMELRRTQKTAFEHRNDELADIIIRLRAELVRLRGRVDRAQSSRLAARLVGVGLQLIEGRRSATATRDAEANHRQMCSRTVREILQDAESHCGAMEKDFAHLKDRRTELRRQIAEARSALECRRKQWSERYSRVLEQLVFEEREGRVHDEDAARALAQIDVDGTIAAERRSDDHLRWIAAFSRDRHEELLSGATEHELQLSVQNAELRDEVGLAHAKGEQTVDAIRVQGRQATEALLRDFARRHALILEDASEMNALSEASLQAPYRLIAQRLGGLTPLSDEAAGLLKRVQPPQLRSYVPAAFDVSRVADATPYRPRLSSRPTSRGAARSVELQHQSVARKL